MALDTKNKAHLLRQGTKVKGTLAVRLDGESARLGQTVMFLKSDVELLQSYLEEHNSQGCVEALRAMTGHVRDGLQERFRKGE